MIVSRNLKTGKAEKTHGMRHTKIYGIYTGIKSRCMNTSRHDYNRYGGRGIKNKWKSFEEFYKDMFPTYKEGLSIDRIDNNGNYCKENCRWITNKQQANNRRSNIFYTYKKETKTLKEWSEFFNVNYKNVWNRINILNWSFEKAINV